MSAVYFVEDSKFDITAKAIRPSQLKDVAFLRKMNAIPMDQATANAVLGTLNENLKRLKTNHPFLYKWREYVISGYKSIFLTSVGFLFRNALDGPIVKNVQMSGLGALGIPEAAKYSFQAFKMFDLYNKQISEIMGQSKHMTAKMIDDYFAANLQYDKSIFKFVHDYATSIS